MRRLSPVPPDAGSPRRSAASSRRARRLTSTGDILGSVKLRNTAPPAVLLFCAFALETNALAAQEGNPSASEMQRIYDADQKDRDFGPNLTVSPEEWKKLGNGTNPDASGFASCWMQAGWRPARITGKPHSCFSTAQHRAITFLPMSWQWPAYPRATWRAAGSQRQHWTGTCSPSNSGRSSELNTSGRIHLRPGLSNHTIALSFPTRSAKSFACQA
jgi:hypothetical protein